MCIGRSFTPTLPSPDFPRGVPECSVLVQQFQPHKCRRLLRTGSTQQLPPGAPMSDAHESTWSSRSEWSPVEQGTFTILCFKNKHRTMQTRFLLLHLNCTFQCFPLTMHFEKSAHIRPAECLTTPRLLQASTARKEASIFILVPSER